jgi:hypothetical protein
VFSYSSQRSYRSTQRRLAGMSHRLWGRTQFPGGSSLLIAPLLVVVVIIGILGATAIPSFADENGRAGGAQTRGQGFEGSFGEEEVTAANPRWYGNGRLLKEGQLVPVTTSGTLTVTNVQGGEFTVRCAVKGRETIENPVGGGAGRDELEELAFSNCSAKNVACPNEQAEIVAGSLAWPSQLIPGPPTRDVLEGVELQVTCGIGAFPDSYTGALMPTIGASVAKFGAGSGELRDPANRKATVTGTTRLDGPRGAQEITAGNRSGYDGSGRAGSSGDREH